jgi:hypothetical protein
MIGIDPDDHRPLPLVNDNRDPIDRIRTALAMRDAGYNTIPFVQDVEALLMAYDKLIKQPTGNDDAKQD